VAHLHLGAIFGLAFYYSDSQQNWRGPVALSVIWPLWLLVIAWFAPESPRWLLIKNRASEAWEIVSKIHVTNDGASLEFARGEFYQMQKQIEADLSMDGSWKALFTKRNYLKRLMLSCGFAVIGQSTGILVINSYVR